MNSPRFVRPVAQKKINSAVVEMLEARQLLSGGLGFGNATTFSVGGGPDALIVADVNGDGKIDIVTANYNGTVSVLFGQANGAFAPAITVPDGLSDGVAVANFSASNDTLSVASGNQAAVLSTAGVKQPVIEQTFQLPQTATSIATITAAGGGGGGGGGGGSSRELLVGFDNGTIGEFGPGSSTVFNTTATMINVGSTPGAITSLATANFANNQPGLIVGDANGSVFGESNFAVGTFGTLSTLVTGSGATPSVNVMTGDFNGDGIPDVITSDYGGNLNFIPVNGEGTFGTPQALTSLPSGVIAGGVGALNGNGVSEPLFLNSTTGQFSILGGNNTGSFVAPVSFNAGAIPDAVQLADVNGDGRPDVITADYYNHSVSVFLNASTVAPTITSANSATFVTGVNGAFPISSAGFPSKSNITVTGALPPGLRIVNSANGPAMLTGVPTAGTGGMFVFTLTSTNSVGAGVSQPFTLTVDQPVAFTTPKAAQFASGVDGTFLVKTTGFPTPAISTRGTVPAGLTFHDNGDGTATITGTPAGAVGSTFSLVLTSGTGAVGAPSQPLTITVTPGGITSTNNDTFTVGTTGTFPITTTGFPPTAATITETGLLPPGVVFKNTGNNTAELAGTPAAGAGKTFTLTLSAKSATFPAFIQAFTLTVQQAPAITSAAHFTFVSGAAATFTPTTTGFPKPTFTLAGGSLPTGVTLNHTTGQLAGNAAAGQGGTFVVTLAATNAVTTTNQTFTITVDEAPAITSADSLTDTTQTAITFPITTTGFPAANITEAGILPSGVLFKNLGGGNGELIGTPSATSGKTYAIVLTATNGISPAATQKFTLTVNQAPAITSANHTTFNRTTGGTFAITSTGFPAPTVTGTGLPSNVFVIPQLNNVFDLVTGPGAATAGTFTLTLTAANGIGADANQVFTLIVT